MSEKLTLFQIRSYTAPELCLDATFTNKLQLKECIDNDENEVILVYFIILTII